MPIKKVSIGRLLIENNLITEEQLELAIGQQKSTGEKLGKVLLKLGIIQEERLLQLLSQQLDLPYVDIKNYSFQQDLTAQLPEIYARRHRAIILGKEGGAFLVGMVDPQDIIATDDLARILKSTIKLALVREDDLLNAIDMLYRRTGEISTLAGELSAEIGNNDFDVTQLATGLSSTDAPVLKLLQSIFEDAVQVNASDVHIEPDEFVLRIRQRIDGVLHEQIVKEKHVAQALTLRLKLMASLNIAEKRLPQDGRFSIKIRNKNFDIRLSTLPVQFGESVVMRLLNQSSGILNLERVGLPFAILQRMQKILALPNGLLLITGPTGSGKTTTLYGALNFLNAEGKKIITVEDPVEYRLPRVNQVQVQTQIGLTFARVLRSVLRQDPDVIMVGELRDQETAGIALRAAMTGHFVLSTLHTNDAISCAVRLIDMGAEGYLVATVLRAVVAQRLVRRICENCSQNYVPSAQEVIWLKSIPKFTYSGQVFKHATGCTYCHNTGYKGQVGVFEILELTPDIADALRKNDTVLFGQTVRKDPTFHPLVLGALDLVQQGITTISEVLRITGDSLEDTIAAIAHEKSKTEQKSDSSN
jgi:MSHA biogenesis protein MshE